MRVNLAIQRPKIPSHSSTPKTSKLMRVNIAIQFFFFLPFLWDKVTLNSVRVICYMWNSRRFPKAPQGHATYNSSPKFEKFSTITIWYNHRRCPKIFEDFQRRLKVTLRIWNEWFFFFRFCLNYWAKLQNTPPLIRVSLNENSIYCYIPRSSKHTDTCNGWTGVFCNRSNYCLFLGQTMIRTPIYAMGRNPELFDDPLKYKPERWLRDDSHKSLYHAFATLPFGFGTRMCLGKYTHADCEVTANE